ncbi:MAG: hypothetical protein ACK559_08490, partial [bacterium]
CEEFPSVHEVKGEYLQFMIAVTASTSYILAASISAANQIVKNKQSIGSRKFFVVSFYYFTMLEAVVHV